MAVFSRGMDAEALAACQVLVDEELYRVVRIVHEAEGGYAALLEAQVFLQALLGGKA